MTDDIPVGCTEKGCDGIVRLAKSVYEDGGDSLIGLRCPHGHRFDHDKYLCPRCGAGATPAEWRPPQVWTGTPPPSTFRQIFNPAKCTSPSCVWEGPK
jgi:hypothetical protein